MRLSSRELICWSYRRKFWGESGLAELGVSLLALGRARIHGTAWPDVVLTPAADSATPVRKRPSLDFSLTGLVYCSMMMFMGWRR